MAFDFAAAKTLARRVVHKTLGVAASYQDASLSTPEDITVRWHSKIDRMGDLENQLYAELIVGIDRVILEAEQARTIGVKRGGTITFGPKFGNIILVIGVKEPADGPYNEVWGVSRKETP